MSKTKKSRYLIPAGPAARDVDSFGATEVKLIHASRPELHEPPEQINDAADTSSCNRCGAPIPKRSQKPGGARCPRCRGKRGAVTEKERQRLTPRERIEISQEIRAQVAAELFAEQIADGTLLRQAIDQMFLREMLLEQAQHTAEQSEVIRVWLNEQAQKYEAAREAAQYKAQAEREERLDEVYAALPFGRLLGRDARRALTPMNRRGRGKKGITSARTEPASTAAYWNRFSDHRGRIALPPIPNTPLAKRLAQAEKQRHPEPPKLSARMLIRKRATEWAARERPAGVSEQDWAMTRLATVDKLKAPTIAQRYPGIRPEAVQKRIQRARRAAKNA